MSGLTSSAASSIALPVRAAPLSTNAPNASNQGGFCEVMNDKKFKIVPKDPQKDDRQDDAATGKDLPEKDKSVDPALAWLLGGMPLPTPVAATPAVTVEGLPDVAPDVLIASGAKAQSADPAATCEIDIAKPHLRPLSATMPASDAASLASVQADVAAQPIKFPLAPPPALATAEKATPAAVVLPAIFALSMADRTDRFDRDEKSASAVTTVSSLAQPATTAPIAPMGDAQRQGLDMGRHDWPQKMIDHIEALRDNANANDTSIRLKPEALGRVDIALRTHADGAISVRFTAEQPTTRTMLVDATPQLSAAAEARGIRLSGTSVDLSGQGDQRPQPQDDRAQPITNRLAPSRGDDIQAADDGRIA